MGGRRVVVLGGVKPGREKLLDPGLIHVRDLQVTCRRKV